MPDLHQEIEQDDVVIGKIIQPSDSSKAGEVEGAKKDRSTIYKYKESARVDKIATTLTKDGATLVNVRTRSLRIPCIGNKYSSRSVLFGVFETLFIHFLFFSDTDKKECVAWFCLKKTCPLRPTASVPTSS